MVATRDNLGQGNIYRLTSLPGINPGERKSGEKKPRDAERARRIKFSRCLSSRASRHKERKRESERVREGRRKGEGMKQKAFVQDDEKKGAARER